MSERPATIGIIGGKGKMGKYFADFFERNNYKVIVSDIGTKLKNADLVKKSDVVIVSVPIDKTRGVIDEIAPLVKSSQLLMDLTSLKVFPVEAMLKSKAAVIGLHPLFGPTNSIEGQMIIISFARPDKWKPWLTDLFRQNKILIREMNPEKHDKMMAYVQVLGHFTDIVLADTLKKANIPIDEFLNYQSPVYRIKLDLMGRLMGQDPSLYSNIQLMNRESETVLNSYIESCKEFAGTVKFQNHLAFERMFTEVADYLGDFCQTAMNESSRVIDIVYSERGTAEVQTGKADIAVLGPRNTYSDLAVKHYKPNATIRYTPTITDVFELVEKGTVQEGLVPFENHLTGTVRETTSNLFEKNVWIQKTILQPVRLALVANEGIKINDINVVYSHAQPLMQTRNFLKKHIPKASLVPMSSTVAALERLKYGRKPGAAAISLAHAAEQYDLKIIKDGIEDQKDNATEFAVITKASKKKVATNADRTSLAFTFSKDSPGNLNSVLQDFAQFGINLTRIESRPHPKLKGEYVFYVDFDGNCERKGIKSALDSVKKKVSEFKILGCYKSV